jgi:hypothetical protein
MGAMPDDALILAVIDVWDNGDEVESQCGLALADDLGLDLVGSTYVEDEVLVVVTDQNQLSGWIVPSCGAQADTSTSVVETPIPGE